MYAGAFEAKAMKYPERLQWRKSSSMPYFVTDAPFFAARPPGRAVVPIHDAMARATFHLLVRGGGRRKAVDVFEWVCDR